MSTYVPSGKLVLLKNIDIDSSYNHEYYFENATAQYNFFHATSKILVEFDDGTYQRKNLNSIRINCNADEIRECKYIMWQNPTFSTKWYYAFVLGIDYENPKTSIIRYQLDVYQTYLFDVSWKASFIERQHEDRYDSNNNPIINTMIEDLDYGSKYQILSKERVQQIPDTGFILFATTLDVSQTTTSGDMPTNLKYFLVPISINFRTYQYQLNGNSLSHPNEVFAEFRYNQSYVGKLVGAYFIPYVCLDNNLSYSSIEGGYNIISNNLRTFMISNERVIDVESGLNSSTLGPQTHLIWESQQNKYQNFPTYDESKLLMYPYSFTEITTQRGDTLILRNEYITSTKIKLNVFQSIGTKGKLGVAPDSYLDKTGDFDFDNMLIDNSQHDLPIVDDYTASYLQANSNAISVAQSNAKLLQQTAIDNAGRTASTNMANAQRELIADTVTGGLEMALGTANVITSLGDEGYSNISGGFSTVFRGVSDYESSKASITTNAKNSRASADANYQTSIATTLAKVQDAEQVPATTKSLGNDYMFDYSYRANQLYVVKKTILPEYANKLGDYFKQFGYKVNKLEVPQFHTRASWNYIKMTQPNVSGNIPMDDLLAIKGIFQKGITLWHGDYVGNYSRNNNEI